MDKGDNHEFYCGAKQVECEYCASKTLAKDLKHHYDFCLNKFAIENIQYKENYNIPTEADYDDDFYNNSSQNVNNKDNFDNNLKKKSSEFKESDICNLLKF